MIVIVSCFVFCRLQASCVPLRTLRQVPDRLPRPTLPPSAPNNPWNTVTRNLQVQVQVQVFFIESRIAGVASMSNSIDVSVLGWRLDVGRTCARPCPPIDQPPTTIDPTSVAAMSSSEFIMRKAVDSITFGTNSGKSWSISYARP